MKNQYIHNATLFTEHYSQAGMKTKEFWNTNDFKRRNDSHPQQLSYDQTDDDLKLFLKIILQRLYLTYDGNAGKTQLVFKKCYIPEM